MKKIFMQILILFFLWIVIDKHVVGYGTFGFPFKTIYIVEEYGSKIRRTFILEDMNFIIGDTLTIDEKTFKVTRVEK